MIRFALRSLRSPARAVVIPLLLPALFACTHAGPRPHSAAGSHGAAVRAAFNADAGKVRVLILGDPT